MRLLRGLHLARLGCGLLRLDAPLLRRRLNAPLLRRLHLTLLLRRRRGALLLLLLLRRTAPRRRLFVFFLIPRRRRLLDDVDQVGMMIENGFDRRREGDADPQLRPIDPISVT